LPEIPDSNNFLIRDDKVKKKVEKLFVAVYGHTAAYN
jgi:hypothetical protein